MAHIAENQWYLDGKDLFPEYGVVISEGADDLLQPPVRKEPYSNDWAEHNGKEYDLSETPKFQDRAFTLKGYIIATGESDFWAKFNALKSALNTAGTKLLHCVEINTSVHVFLTKINNLKRYTRLKNSTKIAVEFEMCFQEVME